MLAAVVLTDQSVHHKVVLLDRTISEYTSIILPHTCWSVSADMMVCFSGFSTFSWGVEQRRCFCPSDPARWVYLYWACLASHQDSQTPTQGLNTTKLPYQPPCMNCWRICAGGKKSADGCNSNFCTSKIPADQAFISHPSRWIQDVPFLCRYTRSCCRDSYGSCVR